MSSRGSFWRKSIVALIAYAAGRPYLLHLHGSEFMTFFDQECGLIRKSFVRVTFKHASLVLVLGPQWQRDVLRICPEANVEVLPNGVPVPSDDRPIKNELVPQILTLGRLGCRKGTYDLLRAFSIVVQRDPSVRLVCAGDGEIPEARVLARDLGIESKVDFPGWLSPDQTRGQLRRATMFVLPSYAEGLPMALLEAMSYGLPVITTPVGGIPEVVSHDETGLLVNAGDVEALASAIIELLNHPSARARLGGAARAQVTREHSLESVLRRIRQIYRRYGVEIGAPDGD
jgi:glycosyltransferase involved in cell wall biosynthesis